MNSCDTSQPTTGAGLAVFASAFNILVAAQCSLTYDFIPDIIKNGDKFDFIVVGAGTAGSIVASRLSEEAGWNVLLLEAGPKQPIESIVPYLQSKLGSSKFDWQYKTENNNKTNQGLKNGQGLWLRGKMLGGSSSINGMVYVRGNEEDYKAWERAGNPSWNKKNVYAKFKKAESYQNQKLKKVPAIKNTYGLKGPQILNRFNSTNQNIDENVLKSYDEIGLKEVADINAVKFKYPGICSHQTVTAANGIRYSSYQSFLLPVRDKRKNLKIVTNAFVTKVLINEKLRSYGIKVDICNKSIKVFAKFEVILCCGAINTPQLLLLSGIGPKQYLESKNIPCKVNLRGVGQNLQNHIAVPIPLYADQKNYDIETDETFEAIKYLHNRTGLLAQATLSTTQAYYSRNSSLKYPEFQTLLQYYNKNSNAIIKKNFNYYKDFVLKSLTEYNRNKALFLFFFHLLHPLSRGKILIRSSNPYDKPRIYPNYFSDPRDLKSSSIAIRMFTKITNTKYFKSMNAFLHRIKIPECDKFTLNSNLYWQCQTKNIATTIYHPIGTAKMGPDPKDSVVDNFLKVYFVDGLRVVDASIMPGESSGNTNAPVTMVGEMGASFIKESYDIPY